MNAEDLSLGERDTKWHLRTSGHVALDEWSNKSSWEADNLGLVVRDRELEVLDELDEDRLHLDNATER